MKIMVNESGMEFLKTNCSGLKTHVNQNVNKIVVDNREIVDQESIAKNMYLMNFLLI